MSYSELKFDINIFPSNNFYITEKVLIYGNGQKRKE